MAKKNVKDILSSTRRQKRRRKLLIMRVTFFSVLILLILGFFIYDINLQRIRIRNVEVVGLGDTKKDLVLNKAFDQLSGSWFYVIPQNSIFFFRSTTLENKLREQFINFDTVKVNKIFPNSLKIEVKEKTPYFIYCVESCYTADQNGFIFETQNSSSTLTLFRDKTAATGTNPIGTTFLSKDVLKNVDTLTRRLREKGIELSNVDIFSKNYLELKLTNSSSIKINGEKEGDGTYQNVMTVLQNASSTFEYIDVRFDRKMFYK